MADNRQSQNNKLSDQKIQLINDRPPLSEVNVNSGTWHSKPGRQEFPTASATSKDSETASAASKATSDSETALAVEKILQGSSVLARQQLAGQNLKTSPQVFPSALTSQQNGGLVVNINITSVFNKEVNLRHPRDITCQEAKIKKVMNMSIDGQMNIFNNTRESNSDDEENNNVSDDNK